MENKLAVNLLIAFYSTADGSGRSGRVFAYLLPRKTHPLLPCEATFQFPFDNQFHNAEPSAVELADSFHPQL